MPIFELDINHYSFPSPESARDDGLLAIGGDLSVDRLLNAYANGIFPWFSEGDPILWWSPNPRFVLFPGKFKARKSLKQKIRNSKFEIRYDYDFKSVIENCKSIKRKYDDDTWITNEMVVAYIQLFNVGVAHTVEVYEDDLLVGGLYGVQIGDVFSGESMFSNKSDGSKIALYNLCNSANRLRIKIIDVQMETSHLESLGGEFIERTEFMTFLNDSYKNTRFERWQNNHGG
jgi:leucyl/phenylalanyl-tRNA--protein transferase